MVIIFDLALLLWACSLEDKALDSESKDQGFESLRA